jgi:hypothetical protein
LNAPIRQQQTAPPDKRVYKALKFCGFLLIDLAVAVIGTAILDAAVRRLIPSQSVAGIVTKEIVLSIVCAAFIGFGMWRTWRNSAAKWTWFPQQYGLFLAT